MPTFIVLNQINRQGTATTNSATVPTNPPESLIATVLIDLANMENIATQVTLDAEVSSDSGATWTRIARGSWEGGQQTQKNFIVPQWRLIVEGLPNHAGKLLRGLLTNDPRFRIGLSVTV